MKILYVAHGFLPESVGGTELYTYYLADEFSKKHEVRIFFNSDSSQEQGFIDEGRYENVPYTAVRNALLSYKDYAPYGKWRPINECFRELLRSYKPDVVHFQHILHLTPDLVGIAKEHRLPVIFTLHDFWLLCHRVQMIAKNRQRCDTNKPMKCALCHYQHSHTGNFNTDISYWRRKGLKRAYWAWLGEYRKLRYFLKGRFQETREMCEEVDLFISPSLFLRKKFIEHGLDPKKIIYSRNGLKTFMHVERRNRDGGNERLRFGFMGGANPYKGARILIQAFEGVTGADLFIFGNITPEDKKRLLNGVDHRNVLFCGLVSGKEKEKAMSQIDVYVMPSLWYENSPLVIQEAYMIGAPVIVSNIGGMAESVKDGETGWHFKVGDPADLRAKMQWVIDNPHKVEEIRAKLPRVKSIEENAVELEGIYLDLIARNRGAGIHNQ
jgi:glycosyltransferase involved in cell wall biosynthesis